ncbi:MAG TPA: hypothetical protein VJ804_12075 [Acidimicrobiales bacterium]|nr:hypothetical protein [Acidimicrobiales bacterium]
MPSKRTVLGAAAFSAALAGGGVAGALLGTPSPSAAQDDTSTSTTEATTEDGARPHRGPFGHRGARLETAAEALGMTAEELKAELEAGTSIAQVAEERGVDVQVVVDALVAEGTERLEQAIEELPTRVGELVQREGLPERPHRGRRPADASAA